MRTSPGRALNIEEALLLPSPDVVHVIDSLLGWGGAEKRLVAELRRMEGLRHVVVRMFERNELDTDLIEHGIPVVALGLEKDREAVAIPRAVWRLRRLAAGMRPRLIHTSLLLSNLVGQVVGASFSPRIPVISSLTRTGDPAVFRRYFSPRGARWKLRLLDSAVDLAGGMSHVRYRAVAEHVKTSSCAEMGLDPRRVTVIPRGVDVAGLQERARLFSGRAAFGLDDGPLYVNVGRIARKNGQIYLIRAFEKVLHEIPEAVLAIAGEGEDAEDEVKELISELGVDGSVKLLGYRDDASELMSVADVVILSSLTEGLPGVLLEGMAVGAPLIAFDVDGSREASGQGEAAALVPPGDTDDLARSMVSLYRDPERREELSRAGEARVSDVYDLDVVADELGELFRSVMGDPVHA